MSEWWDFPLRKLAHMMEYAVLAQLVARGFRGSTRWSAPTIYIAALIAVLLYATSDEIHQGFVVGRHGSLIDVLIDVFGAWVGLKFKPKPDPTFNSI